MGIRQPLIGRIVRAVVCGLAPAAGAAGCATFAGISKDLHELSAATGPNPVSYVPCVWQNRLTTLPDPLRNGAPTPGIVGQVYFYDAGYLPNDPAGELTIVVSDATPRPPGQAGPPAEAWHFTNATLKNLKLMDERIGRCHVVFLPWPATWRDVAKVRFQARYDQPNGPTVFAPEAEVTLDFTPGPNGALPGTGGGGAVPNPTEMLKQARAAQAAGRTAQPRAMAPPVSTPPPAYYPPPGSGAPPTIPPAGYYAPPQGAVATPPAGYYGPPPGYGAAAGAGVQPAIVPFRPPGTEVATPGPPEIRTQFP